MTDVHASTGHNPLTPDLLCERFSILVPFFWLTKQTVTNIAFWLSWGSSWSTCLLSASLKMIFPAVRRLVFPGLSVRQNSQALIAKKYPPRISCAVCWAHFGIVRDNAVKSLSNMGVTAF